MYKHTRAKLKVETRGGCLASKMRCWDRFLQYFLVTAIETEADGNS